jgi:hypothetical protein
MYQPLSTLTEELDLLQTRLRSECDPQLRPRLNLLVLLQSGQVTTRRQAAAHLAVHRHTIKSQAQTAAPEPCQKNVAAAADFVKQCPRLLGTMAP